MFDALSPIPHEQIRELMDRSFTLPLVAVLRRNDLSAEDRETIERTVMCLEDPQATMPSRALLEHASLPNNVRESGLTLVTQSAAVCIDEATCRSWFAQSDPYLQRAAVASFRRSEQDLVASALDDSNFELRVGVLAATAFGFEETHWQERKIRALSDSDPAMRACAAHVLLWDEPVAAELPLLSATYDTEEDVAVEALDTLRYYPSLRVAQRLFAVAYELPSLADLPSNTTSLRRMAMARASLDSLVDDWRDPIKLHEGEWFANARTFIETFDRVQIPVATPEPTEEEDRHAEGSDGQTVAVRDEAFVRAAAELHAAHSNRGVPLNADELMEQLENLNGQWALVHARLHGGDPQSVANEKRETLALKLMTHVDPEVRSSGARYLAAYAMTDELLRLLDDPDVATRKSAAYALHDVPPSAEVAEQVIAPVRSGELGSTRAYEAVRTWARHRSITSPSTIEDELLAFTSDLRESVRCEAVEQLISRNAVSARDRLLALLAEPPLVTWGVHTSIMSGRGHTGLTTAEVLDATKQWHETDNLWLQVALDDLRQTVPANDPKLSELPK
jgi:hypothetical protein